MRCSDCGTNVPVDKLRCPKCKAWVVHRSSAATKGVPIENDGTVLLSDVTSAEENRIDIGLWNPMWGGGLVRTSTSLIAGTPGAGKSTLMLQLMGLIALLYAPREVVYVAAEESLPEIRMRSERLGIPGQSYIRMIPAMKGVDDLGGLILKYKPSAVVLDSLQGLASDDPSMQKQLCKIAKEYAVDIEAPFLIISHINKGGDIAGAEELQHEVDTTLVLSGEGEDVRVFENKKNRNGQCKTMAFEMTQKGLVLANLDEPEDEEAPKEPF